MRFFLVFLFFFIPLGAYSQALEEYLNNDDRSFRWEKTDERRENGLTIYVLSLISQRWQNEEWRHELALAVPDKAVSKEHCFITIGGGSTIEANLDYLRSFVRAGGTAAAHLRSVPNQPLFGGKKEDALLAYTLRRFIDSGDKSWPIIFPMVKSGVRAMDALTEFSKSINFNLDKFAVSGASKRGWTTYLLGAVDKRIVGIAPLVFDMLNMKAQTDWAQKAYGAQSEKIKNYTELGLVERISEPRTAELRKYIDPYEYLSKLNVPKLILIGTNDPYWVVDAQRHYFPELPGDKLLYQVPNGSHHISGDPVLSNTLITWYRLLVAGKKLPVLEWSSSPLPSGAVKLKLKSSSPLRDAFLWQADAPTYDFRKAKWSSRPFSQKIPSVIDIAPPSSGYRAFLADVIVATDFGDMKLSTTAQVLPGDQAG